MILTCNYPIMFFIGYQICISSLFFGVKGLGSSEDLTDLNCIFFDRNYSQNRDSCRAVYHTSIFMDLEP